MFRLGRQQFRVTAPRTGTIVSLRSVVGKNLSTTFTWRHDCPSVTRPRTECHRAFLTPSIKCLSRHHDSKSDTSKSAGAPAQASSGAGKQRARDDQADADDTPSLRWLLRLALPQWRLFAAGLVFLFASQCLSLSFPKAVEYVTSLVSAGKPILDADNTTFAALCVGVLVGGSVAIYFRTSLTSRAGAEVTATLRGRVFRSLLAQPVVAFDRAAVGDLVARLSADCGQVGECLAETLPTFVRNLTTCVAALGMMLYTSPGLAGTCAGMIAFAAPASVWYGRRYQQRSRRIANALGDASDYATERLGGIRTVKAFGREAHVLEGLCQKAAVVAEEQVLAGKLSGAFFAFVTAYLYGVMFGIVAVGGHMVATGALTGGQLTSFVLYAMLMMMNGLGLGSNWSSVKRAVGTAGRIAPILRGEDAEAYAAAEVQRGQQGQRAVA
eukprot:TRINITY_DN70447_c0_g1_i1.p1 TRINITY_DN70447_c0_g1~~TRINITY_DN70447_c0_g1_i1.p1  ORF type:complete len:440 (+),score=84.10 TRINITY_DN70447_c0_g1_i1:127-1446(+)